VLHVIGRSRIINLQERLSKVTITLHSTQL